LLRTVLRDQRRMERLRHLPRIGTGILELGRSTRILRSCSPAILTEIAASGEELHRAPTAACIKAHLALLDELGLPLARPFRSLRDLRDQHRELADGFHELRRELEAILRAPPPPPVRHQPAPTPPPHPRLPQTKHDESFPDPPFPGNQHVVPLTTRDQLQTEGRVQANCVASYFQRVKNGSLYIYRVLWPERCTLSIAKRRTGQWVIQELEAARNTRVRNETRRWIEDWIRTNRNQLEQSA